MLLAARHHAVRVLLAGAVVAVIGGCSLLDPGLPTHGHPTVGVPYRLTAYCLSSFVIGDELWEFPQGQAWPPMEPDATQIMIPYPVEGTLTLTTKERAVFVADVDGSALSVRYVQPWDGGAWTWGCI